MSHPLFLPVIALLCDSHAHICAVSPDSPQAIPSVFGLGPLKMWDSLIRRHMPILRWVKINFCILKTSGVILVKQESSC